ncbi:MAG: TIGR03067 domain-containing protein [Planctomycetes bacterium]|nr:TIGR03067 domain-containing protein [Planctomycetota bacterium]
MRSIRVTTLALALAALAGCGKKAETGAPSGAGGDRDRLQGTWAIETFDEGRHQNHAKYETLEDVRPPNPADPEDIAAVRLTFDGDRLTIALYGETKDALTVVLDETANPKVLKLTEVLDADARPRGTFAGTKRGGPAPAREPEKQEWIYKFDGDKLVVAFSKGGDGPRPTEFKARLRSEENGKEVPRVTVVTLKKTDAPPPARPRYTTTSRGTRK